MPINEFTNLSYDDYLKGSLWDEIRERVLKRDGYTCRICGGKARLVHHESYEDDVMNGINLEPLMSLCRDCHDRVEFDDDNIKINSPHEKILRRKHLQALANECFNSKNRVIVSKVTRRGVTKYTISYLPRVEYYRGIKTVRSLYKVLEKTWLFLHLEVNTKESPHKSGFIRGIMSKSGASFMDNAKRKNIATFHSNSDSSITIIKKRACEINVEEIIFNALNELDIEFESTIQDESI